MPNMTDAEILAAIRAALGVVEAPVAIPKRPMLSYIEHAEVITKFARFFESLWEFWCTPCDKPQYLVKLAHNFIIVINHDDQLRKDLGLDIPASVLADFMVAMQEMAMTRWGVDITKNISPHASSGGIPPISIPGG